MAKSLGLPIATYYRYMGKIAAETKKERLRKTDQLLHRYFTSQEDILAELDSRYAKTQDPAILKMRSDILHQTFDRLQSAGFINNAPKNINLGADDDLKKWISGCMKSEKKVTAKR